MNNYFSIIIALLIAIVFLFLPTFFATLGVLNGIEQFFKGDKILGLISINVSILLFNSIISKGK